MGIRKKREEVGRCLRLSSILLVSFLLWVMVIEEPSYCSTKKEISISTEEELRELCKIINEVNAKPWESLSTKDIKNVTFVLNNDIKLTEKWVPIGLDSSSCFNGTFDGRGHVITNLTIDDYYEHSGFFGYLDGTVLNLTIEGYNYANSGNCAGLAGTLSDDGYVNNCMTSVSVKGKDKVGGIVGNNLGGTIENCVNKGNIHGTHKVGGVVGENWGGSIYNSGNWGYVKSTRRGVATYGTGGVAGRSVSSDSVIKDSYNLGNIRSNTEATGGIVGYVNGLGSTVIHSYNKGIITINLKSSDKDITRAYCGGIVGIAGSVGVEISNCYNSAEIRNADLSGGIIGKYINSNEFIQDKLYISNNYYIINDFDDAIGFVNDKRDDYVDKAGKGVSGKNLEKLVFATVIASLTTS